jgi:hypothetical protein
MTASMMYRAARSFSESSSADENTVFALGCEGYTGIDSRFFRQKSFERTETAPKRVICRATPTNSLKRECPNIAQTRSLSVCRLGGDLLLVGTEEVSAQALQRKVRA